MVDDNDDFSKLQLDDEFINGASSRELSAKDRERQIRREKSAGDELEAKRKAYKKANRPYRRLSGYVGNHKQAVVVAVIVIVVLLIAFWSDIPGLGK